MAVGAPNATLPNTFGGAVFLYRRAAADGAWTYHQTLTAPTDVAEEDGPQQGKGAGPPTICAFVLHYRSTLNP
jgi:hypothetical protein